MNGDDDKLNKLTSPIQKVQRRKLKQTKWNNIKFKGMNDS